MYPIRKSTKIIQNLSNWMIIWIEQIVSIMKLKLKLNLKMKLILALAVLLGLVVADPNCSHDLEVICVDDINKVYPFCKKAAEEKGKDQPVDLNCLKYSSSMDE